MVFSLQHLANRIKIGSSLNFLHINRYYCTNNNNNGNNNNGNNNHNNNGNKSNSTTPPQHPPPFPNYANLMKYTKYKPTKNIIIHGHNHILRSKELVERGHYQKAEKSILHGFRYIQSRVNPLSSIFAIPNHAVGLVSYKMGKFAIGEQFLKYSLDRMCDIDEDKSLFFKRNHIEATNDLGLTLLRQGRSQEAEEKFFKALELSKKTEIQVLLPSIYSNIGEYYKELCYYEKSNEYHGLAHSQLLYNTSGLTNTSTIGPITNGALEDFEISDLSRIYMNRGQILRISKSETRDFEEAKVFFDQGFKLLTLVLARLGYSSSRIPKHNDYAKALIELGHFYYLEGNIEKALGKLVTAKQIFEEMGNLNTPDSVFNLLNIAIIMKYYNPMSLDFQQLSEYLVNLILKIETSFNILKSEGFISRFNRIENLLKSLKSPPSSSSNSTSLPLMQKSSKTSAVELVKLIDPQHFQLSCFAL